MYFRENLENFLPILSFREGEFELEFQNIDLNPRLPSIDGSDFRGIMGRERG